MSSEELLKNYAEGRREFFDANLKRANLSETDLSEAKLFEADLSEADLFRANLSRANLSRANLSRANLSRVNLSRANLFAANLSDANLSRADLSGADLSGADLSRADLSGADLSGADLSRAYLAEANLSRANLTDTNLKEAYFIATFCSQLVLRDVPGLEAIAHLGPSSLDLATLQQSWGRIPSAFLRGCGLADWQIEMVSLHDPALRSDQRSDILYEIHRLQEGAPIVFHSVFISYSTADEEFCVKLHADLQNEGVRCWFAPHDIQSGKKIHEQIDRAIHQQDRLLLVLSRASMSSAWVKTEIANARQKEREQDRAVLFPIRLVSFAEIRSWKLFDADAGTDTGREVREYFIPDFSEWRDESKYRPAFERLVKALRTVDPTPSSPP
jgi:uncharacterized protein YjbI with pentapeptide repeats